MNFLLLQQDLNILKISSVNLISYCPGKKNAKKYNLDDREVIESGEPKLNIEDTVQLKNGKTVIVISNKVPLKDSQGQVIGILGIATDITERKKIEESLRQSKIAAEAANQSKSSFIANMSHDIRTPISGILGIAKILEQEGNSKKDRAYATIIHNSATHLLALLNDILMLISSDTIQEKSIHLETFKLKERMEHVYELFASNVKIQNIKFKIHIDPQLPEYVIGDRVKVDRILLNLVGNAIKFTKQGYVKLKAKLAQAYDDSISVEFTIHDTGIGIPKNQVKNIFDQFYRAKPSYEGEYTGCGIGLFIVKQFVTALNGKIEVKSTLGKSTIFRVTLPLQIDKNMTVSSQERIDIQPTEKVSLMTNNKKKMKAKKLKLKALVIENDYVARTIAINLLESSNLEIDSVDNAEAAFKLIKNNCYNLIITDVGLPGINGFELTMLTRYWEKKIQATSPLLIVGLSAHASNQVEKESLSVGMNILLAKPLNQEKIKIIMQKIGLNSMTKKAADNTDEIKKNKNISSELNLYLSNMEEKLLQIEQFPLFDKSSALKALGSEKTINEVLTMLVQKTLPEEIPKLEQAHASLEWELIEEIVHKLKGGSIYCGATRMQYICKYLEKYQAAGHTKLLEQLYQQLIKVLRQTNTYILDMLSEQNK